MAFLLNFLKDNLSSTLRMSLLFICGIIFFICFYKINNFIKNANSIREQNILLNTIIIEQTEKIKNQNIVIINYKKILKKEAMINLKLSKINNPSSEEVKSMNVEKINNLLNCHLDNFKNLDILCNE